MNRILFVCVENSSRSQMAEAFARFHGAGRIEVFSAGSHPSGQVHPLTSEVMREVGYDMGRHRSKSLADIPEGDYDVAVTMGCGDQCPLISAMRRENWSIPDTKQMSAEQLRGVRDLIEQNVKELIAVL
jgi:arsenate reductase